jgi:hypothetical protein
MMLISPRCASTTTACAGAIDIDADGRAGKTETAAGVEVVTVGDCSRDHPAQIASAVMPSTMARKAVASNGVMSHMTALLQQLAGALDLGVALLPALGIEPLHDVVLNRSFDHGGRQHVGFPAAIAILGNERPGPAVGGLHFNG